MSWITRIVRKRPGEESGELPYASPKLLRRKVEHTRVAVRCAYSFGWQVQDWRYGLLEHSARVALLARWIGARIGLREDRIRTVEHAAQLHEIGMIAVPATLIAAERPLTTDELERVRSHTRIGAEIVRASYERVKADLVEHQYSDYAALANVFPEQPVARQLAGILRVADVYDTLTHPRPYQRGISPERWREVLSGGAGTMFHPDAADTVLLLDAGEVLEED